MVNGPNGKVGVIVLLINASPLLPLFEIALATTHGHRMVVYPVLEVIFKPKLVTTPLDVLSMVNGHNGQNGRFVSQLVHQPLPLKPDLDLALILLLFMEAVIVRASVLKLQIA